MQLKDVAIRYRKDHQLSIFPVNLFWDDDEEKVKKKPAVTSWKPYQEEKPSVDQVKSWWEENPNHGIGIVTGKINDLLVLDVDTEEGEEFVYEQGIGAEPSPTVRTGGGGLHIYFSYPGSEITTGARISRDGLGLDYRGQGGFVVAPPSPYPSPEPGKYKWEYELKEHTANDPPDWLLEEIKETKSDGHADVDELLEGVEKGSRNNSAAAVAGHLLTKFDEENWDLAWNTLQAWNQKNDPPLPKDELETTFKSIAKKEKSKEKPFQYIQNTDEKDDSWKTVNKVYKDGEKTEARYAAAQALLNERNFVALSEGDQLLTYKENEGTFNDYGREYIETRVQHKLSEDLTTHDVNEIIGHVKRSSYRRQKDFGPDDPGLLCVKNGVLDVETGKLHEHSPSYEFQRSLPVKYDPDATSENLDAFLKSTLREKDIPLIEEVAGFCLYRDYFLRKAVMFIGEGGNGKTITLQLIEHLLGHGNVAGWTLQELETNQYAKANLYQKYANIAGDLPGKRLQDTGIFKQLTGRDHITGDVKYAKRPIEFVNFAKLLFSTNNVPATPDDTEAFFDRWVLIEFPYKFVENPTGENEKKKDPKILDKITTEKAKSAFLNRAIRGLKRLRENGEFSFEKDTSQVRKQYERLSQPIKAFADDFLIQDEDNFIPKDRVYNSYREYCEENELPVKSKSVFSRKLSKHIKVSNSQHRIDGERKRCYEHIDLDRPPF